MRDEELPVSFRPPGRRVFVLPGTRLIEAAAEAGLVIEVPCGGQGLCGKCRVRVVSGATDPTPIEQQWLSADELHRGWRLACQSAVAVPMEVEQEKVPGAISCIGPHGAAEKRFLTPFSATVQKRSVELPAPKRGDDRPDLLRLEQALDAGPLEADLPVLSQLPSRLRAADFRGTAVLAENRLIRFRAGQHGDRRLRCGFRHRHNHVGGGARRSCHGRRAGRGVAAESTDAIRRRRPLAHPARPPKLRRTSAVEPDGRRRGRRNDRRVVPAVRRRRERIYAATFAGNTTMQQLLCGVDTSSLGEVPFSPATGRALTLPAAQLGVPSIPAPQPTSCPSSEASSAATLWQVSCQPASPTPTNRRCWSTSAPMARLCYRPVESFVPHRRRPAPPSRARRISCGMRGSTGAIEKVVVDGRLRINVIGNTAPLGLCGSGLIDVAAELLRHGILTSQGRLKTPDELPTDLLPDLAERIVLADGKVSFRLAEAESGTGHDIVLTQRDIRELQLAAGAIRAGIGILLRKPDWRRRISAACSLAEALATSSAAATRSASVCCRTRSRAADSLHGQYVLGRCVFGGPVA